MKAIVSHSSLLCPDCGWVMAKFPQNIVTMTVNWACFNDGCGQFRRLYQENCKMVDLVELHEETARRAWAINDPAVG